jgi:hypothetical protein
MWARGLETGEMDDGWSLRLFVLPLFAVMLFVGGVSAYYVLANTNWGAMDKNLAVTTELFYVYGVFLGVVLLLVLAWLVVDERKIRGLQNTPKT